MSRLSKKPLDNIVDGRILGEKAAGKQVDNLGILRRKEQLKSCLDRGCHHRKIALQKAQQQNIELPHPPATAPAQAGEASSVQDWRGQRGGQRRG